MRIAKSTACLPDITLQDLGSLDLAGAQRAFDTFPWAENLRKSEELAAAGTECVTPDLTFLIAPCHITLKLNDDGVTFALEVCVTRARKLLGIIGGVKFYEIPSVSPAECKKALDVFFTASTEEQHTYFEGLKNAAV